MTLRSRSVRITTILCTGVLSGWAAAQTPADDPGWPRRYSNATAELIVYSPQVESWTDFKTIRGRCAIALKPAVDRELVYGTFRFEADTLVDANQKPVLVRGLRAFDGSIHRRPDAVAWSF